jgi:methylisocitrate lyase
VIIGRTDARAVEGFDAAVSRAEAYLAAGADWIFPEALADAGEFEKFADVIDAPLVANMTEFGKSPYLSDDEFASLGYALVLHPATTFRLAARSIKDALLEMKRQGNQESLQRDGRLMPRGEIDSYLKPNP